MVDVFVYEILAHTKIGGGESEVQKTRNGGETGVVVVVGGVYVVLWLWMRDPYP